MEGFVAATRVSELAPGVMTTVTIERRRVLVANVGGEICALRDTCGHQGAPLSTGMLTGNVVECPLHFACFDVRTGKLLAGPPSADVPVHEVRVEDDTIYVRG